VNFDFDFGDGETSDGVTPEVTHYYQEEGTYRMELEVTDQNGVKDRRPLTVIVASPAAHLEASHERADIGDTVTFDASASLTDFGAINSYIWEIERIGDSSFSYGPTSGGEEFEYEFSQPGDYIVTVEVTDSSGQSNATSLNVTISSSEPVAAFDYEQGSSARPNILTFDGTSSYDPDEGDDLTPFWAIEEQGYESLAQFIEGTDSASWKPVIEFFEPGDYTISLTVSDQYEGDLKQTNIITKEVSVDSVLAIGVRNTGQTAIFLNEEGTAEVELELSTSTGQAFEINWGDGGDVETFSNGSSSTLGGDNRFHVWGMAGHKYSEAGTFHVSITVLDAENHTNSLTRNVYIGNGTEPIPVLNAYIDNVEAQDPNNVEANRTNTIRFDAGDSVDLDGNPINQTGAYSWVLGDGTRATGKQLTKSYDELGDFEVTLTVRSSVDSSIAASTTINISITDAAPQLFGMTIQPQSEEAITPLVVKATANAHDSDGEITRYKFWYYDVNNSSETLGEQISLTPETYLTINTKGTTGQVNTYAFAVEITDNENNTVSSFDEIPADQMPTIEVENGPNNAPEADISVDRTNVMVGETVTFTSNSFDEDGEIVEYIWDLEGDGFFNNPSVSESTILHEYIETHPEGVPVRLKIVDNTGATDVSNPIRIYVDSLTQDPIAAFRYEVDVLTVTLVNNSSADTENNAEIASYAWDFDTSKDADGDGDGSNDVDSTEENPKHIYENFGAHTVQLTVTDTEGNTDSVSNIVQLIEIAAPKAGFKYEVVNDLAVQFENVSIPGDEDAAPIETYKWDFDADGITDSDQREPRFEFSDYGTYQTMLIVTDALDRSDDYTKTVTIEEPEPEELVAFLTTVPAGDPSRGGDIYLEGESGNVTFSYRSKDGVGEVKYCIDKNVFFDTDGNGEKDDDCDNPSGQAGSWKTSFSKDWGMIVVKMTAKDELEREYTVTKQIFFENPAANMGGTSLLPVSTMEGLYILLTALGFTLLGAKLYTRKQEETSL
jgi:PKD repeat protein